MGFHFRSLNHRPISLLYSIVGLFFKSNVHQVFVKMSHKKNHNQKHVPIRRSPRFPQIVVGDPITRNPEPRRTRVPSSATPLTLTGKNNDNSKIRSTRFTIPNHCANECNAENSLSSLNRTNSKYSFCYFSF